MTAGGDSSYGQTRRYQLEPGRPRRFVQRVEQAFQDLSDQGGSVRLRLSPPELGSLHIEINVAKGEMTARVQAETPPRGTSLLDNLPALRERLAQHDIKVQRFDVDLMDRSARRHVQPVVAVPESFVADSGGTVGPHGLRGSSELPGTVERPQPGQSATEDA